MGTGTIEIILQPPVGDDQLCDTLYCAAAAVIDQATTYANIVDKQDMHRVIDALAEELRAVAASAGVAADWSGPGRMLVHVVQRHYGWDGRPRAP